MAIVKDLAKHLSAHKAALLLIDLQNDFVSWTPNARAILPALNQLLKVCRTNMFPVIHVIRHYSEDGSDVELPRVENFLKRPFVVAGTPGADMVPEVSPIEGEPVIIKKRWSAFFGTGLTVLLEEKGIDTLFVGGIFTPNCVRATVFDAISHDIHVFLVSDGTASEDQDVQDANVLDMVNIGVKTVMCAELGKAVDIRGKQ